mgnify:CR=1 FL=1
MNQELLAQIINSIRMNQQQGAVGNVSNNEAAMFSGNPMNGAMEGMKRGQLTPEQMMRIKQMQELKRRGAMGSDFQPEVMNENRIPNSDIDRYIQLRNMANPNQPQEAPISLPIDIDGASAGAGISQKDLNILLQQLDRMR